MCGPDPFLATNFSGKIRRSLLDNLEPWLCDGLLVSCVSAQDAVVVIPGRPEWPDSGGSFDGSNKSHRDQMWIGRVALFFRCTFKKPGPPEQNAPIPCVLALVNRFRQFTAPQARKQPSEKLTRVPRADRIFVLQRDCFKSLACHCFTSVLLPLTFVSFPSQTSLQGLVCPRCFFAAGLSLTPSRMSIVRPRDTSTEVRQTQQRQPAREASCMR